jgi:heat shock protein HslJ
MQQRPQALTIALIVVAVGVGGLLLFAFLNRGPDTGTLTGRTWQLAAITGETPAFQGVVPTEDQPRYTIAFADDGTFAARADCNTMAGTYELRGDDGMTITPGPSTLVACPDGSYGSLFAHALGQVTIWVIQNDELTLTTADGGTGTFVEGSGEIPVETASPSATPTPSPTPSPTPTPTPSPTPTPTPSPTPTPTPSPTPVATPTPEPTETAEPTEPTEPTEAPTAEPTEAPTAEPTATPAPTPTPTVAPTPTPPPSPGADLIGTSWQLAAYTTREPQSGAEIPAAERSKYTVAFAADSTFSATADCNTVIGQWAATADGGLSIVPGPSTIVLCPEGSHGDLYVLALTNSASYAIADQRLTITLRDGGTLVFEPTP